MNIRSLTLLAVGLAVGAAGAFYYFKTARPLENAKYVIAFKEVPLANEAAFIAALKVPDKAVFRRGLKIVRTAGGNAEQPPGFEDAGDTQTSVMKVKSDSKPDMGQQVTQRVGFNNKKNLEEALSYLSPTPTPTPSP